MKLLIQTFAITLCVLATTSAHAQSPGQAVKPGQLFEGDLLKVHAPDSEEWLLAGAGSNGMAFARRGTETNETYAAQVILFKLPPTSSSEEFAKVIKERVDMANPPSRFAVIETSAEYTAHRGYPCISYKNVYDDKEALTTSGTTESLKLQVIALYCRHPATQEIGFFAAYSHRGSNTDPNLEAPAQSFIDGVQVPAQKQTVCSQSRD